MKTIIAGGRDILDRAIVSKAIHYSNFKITEVVSGGASGVDAAGEDWAHTHNLPIERFPANWDTHGRAAGPIRNRQMAEYAEALILVWDGKSRGSANMLQEAKRRGLKIHQHIVS